MSKSPSFIPTPDHCNHNLVFSFVIDFIRKLHWHSCFFSSFSSDSCRFGLPTSCRWPPSTAVPASVHRLTRKIFSAAHSILFTSHHCFQSSNLSSDERDLLRNLRLDPSVVIVPSDKGGRWTILDSGSYHHECLRLLNDSSFYRNIPTLTSLSVIPTLNMSLQSLFRQGYISKRELSFLLPSNSHSHRTFKILPKLHKTTWPSPTCPPGRPVISDVNTESSNVARMIDYFLFPLVSRLDSFILDSRHLISLLDTVTLAPHSLLCTFDVRSLYTNVPIEEGLRRVSRAFLRNPDPRRPDNTIIDLLRISLEHNDFCFADSLWLQTSGVAMGKAFGGAFAGLYLGEWEHQALHTTPLSPRVWYRFQDDIFLIWDHGLDTLHQFLNHLNSLDSHIQVDMSFHSSSIRFLDLDIYRLTFDDRCPLGFRIAFKDTHSHLILPHSSHHAKHVTPGVIFSQVLRWATHSSSREDFLSTSREVFPRWRSQGISRSLIRSSLNKVNKLTNFIEDWSPGFERCGSNACGACGYAKPSKSFRVSSSHFVRPITYRLSCNSRNIIYVIQCLNCPAFYVGHSCDFLRSRIGHHLRNISSGASTKVAAHFRGSCLPQHFSFYAIDRTLSERNLKRKEEVWIRRLQATKWPGLNSLKKTKAATLNLVTLKGQCTEQLNSVIRRACADAGLPPVRLCYKTDRNLRSLLRK